MSKKTLKKRVMNEMVGFTAKSVWSGDVVKLKFRTPRTAMMFQNAIVKKGCFVKE